VTSNLSMLLLLIQTFHPISKCKIFNHNVRSFINIIGMFIVAIACTCIAIVSFRIVVRVVELTFCLIALLQNNV